MAAKRTTREHGFTLIEILAVLIILGLLAAVAIPKYQNLQDEARQQVLGGAIAAAQSHLNLTYSRLLMENNGLLPTLDDVVSEAKCDTDIQGSFTISCAADGSITATDSSGATRTDTWALP